jgi:hypothetical protein
MTQRRCPNCGRSQSADAIYCPYCDALLDPPNQPAGGFTPPFGLSTPVAIGLALLLLLCLVGGSVAAVLAVANGRTEATPTPAVIIISSTVVGVPPNASPVPTPIGATAAPTLALPPTATLPGPTPTPEPTEEPAVTTFGLIDADSDRPIEGFGSIPDGAILNLAALPTLNLNIVANTSGPVESVRFEMDGVTLIVENEPPYALVGNAGDDFYPWTPLPGQHTLTAVPYLANAAEGETGDPLTITFTVLGP